MDGGPETVEVLTETTKGIAANRGHGSTASSHGKNFPLRYVSFKVELLLVSDVQEISADGNQLDISEGTR